MRHLFFWIIFVPVVIVLAIFTIWNTQAIALNLWPLPWEVPVPAYALVFGSLLIGFLFGLLVMWRHGAPHRRRHRDLHRQFNLQATELNNLKRQAATTPSANTGKALAKADVNALVPPAI